MRKILIVEDDWELNQGICYALENENYTVKSAHSIKEAEDIIINEPDLSCIVLDVNLPDGEGFSLCRQVKDRGKTPVLFLTARDLEEDMLRGYELGAEDYVTKPFSIKVLLKKIQVILKRDQAEIHAIFDDGFLSVNLQTASVKVNSLECSVTPTEFRLLRCFISHPGQLLTYSILLEQLWDHDGRFVDKHTLAVNVNRLRSKIEDEQHRYISNVYGMGYQWLENS